MTVSKNLVISCDGCRTSETWDLDVLEHRTMDSVLKNAGYETEPTESILSRTEHYCADCNDREKETFYVYGGYGEEYLGPVDAWGIVDARNEAWKRFGVENMVKREKTHL